MALGVAVTSFADDVSWTSATACVLLVAARRGGHRLRHPALPPGHPRTGDRLLRQPAPAAVRRCSPRRCWSWPWPRPCCWSCSAGTDAGSASCPRSARFNVCVLVERAGVLSALAERAADAGNGRGSAVFLGGEAGVGKTSVVRALTADAAGLAVRVGGCDSVVAGEPLGPFLDAVPEMAALPELSDATAAGRPGSAVPPGAPACSPPNRPCSCVEDVQWADEATCGPAAIPRASPPRRPAGRS